MAGISRNVRILMILSGLTGLTMFVLANFYLSNHEEWRLATAILQISANAFVTASWFKGFMQATPRTLMKRVAMIGFSVPAVMATITFFRVVLPTL